MTGLRDVEEAGRNIAEVVTNWVTDVFAHDEAQKSLDVLVKTVKLVVNAATLDGGGDQWIMEWEGELIHPTDLPEGRYLVIPVTEDE